MRTQLSDDRLGPFKNAWVLEPTNAVFTDKDVADLFPYVHEAASGAAASAVKAAYERQ